MDENCKGEYSRPGAPMHWLPSLLPAALILILCLSPVTAANSFADEQYYDRFRNCAPLLLSCGGAQFNISYPFRVDGRRDYCGYPNYVVACSRDNSTLTTSVSGVAYQVKDMNYVNHLLTIVDPRLLTETCPLPSAGITIDSSLYDYSDRDQNVTLLANCSAAPSSTPDLHEVDCAAGPGRRWYYRLQGNDGSSRSWGCRSTVVVGMHKTTAYLLSVGNLTFGKAVKEGFSLKWTAGKGWCSDCISSGGRCGYNGSSPTCYCPHRSAIGVLCPPSYKVHKRDNLIFVV